MTMPGFTAENALHPTSQRYRGQLDYATISGEQRVAPALSIYVDGFYFCEGYIDWFGNVRCFRRFPGLALS